MKTRVHELLGVEPGEVFTVKGYGGSWYTDDDGTVRTNCHDEEKSSWMAFLLNHPDLIIRRPRLTDEQREVLAWLQKGRFTHVCIDPDKEMTAYDQMPRRQNSGWFASEDDYAGVFGRVIEPLRPLIPDWKIPLDVKKALEGGWQG